MKKTKREIKLEQAIEEMRSEVLKFSMETGGDSRSPSTELLSRITKIKDEALKE